MSKHERKDDGLTNTVSEENEVPGKIAYVVDDSASSNANSVKQTKFYEKKWFLWVSLVFLPPLGIFLLWKFHPGKTKKVKIILTVIFALWFIIVMVTPKDSGNSTANTNTSNSAVESTQDSSKSSSDYTDSSNNTSKVEAGGLKNKTLTDALETLKSNGEKYTIINASNKYDFTDEAKEWSTEYTDLWLVKDATNIKGSWQLSITTQEAIDAENREKALQDKLDIAAALTAVEQYGEKEYPYGFKLKTFTGAYSETAIDDDTWSIKYGCKVTNMYGATQTATCEAKITGTTSAPEVIAFSVY